MGVLKVYDGALWKDVGIPNHTHVEADIIDLGDYITASSVDTLTNKTIDGDNNTVIDLDPTTIYTNETGGSLITWNGSSAAALLAPATAGKVLTTQGAGSLPTWETPFANVVEDITPQAGGTFDMNGNWLEFDDATGIRDDSGNELLVFQKSTSATRYVEITNATSLSDVRVGASAGDLELHAPSGSGIEFIVNTTQEAKVDAGGLDVANLLTAESLRADGDAGGAASTNTFTNASLAEALFGTAFSIKAPTGYSGSTKTWIKIYIGTATYVIPCLSQA